MLHSLSYSLLKSCQSFDRMDMPTTVGRSLTFPFQECFEYLPFVVIMNVNKPVLEEQSITFFYQVPTNNVIDEVPKNPSNLIARLMS